MSADGLDGPGGANVGGAYVIFGKNTATAGPFPAVLEVSALNGTNGFVMYGVTANDFTGIASAAGDINGDGYDDIITETGYADPNGITDAGQSYVVYGRPSFGASLELASLLAANGGDGSAGYALNGFSVSAGQLLISPGLAISTTTATPTCGSRPAALTPTGSRTTARCTSSTASLLRP